MGHRNSCSAEKCPENLLEEMEPSQLNKWLSIFIAETRKVNGEPYPPKSLHLLLSGLQRHMKSFNKERAPNIFAKNDPAFTRLHQTMDSLYRKLRASGVGAQKRSTETFTKEEENQLWVCGVLGIDNPTSLLRAVFFLTMARSFVYEEVKSIGIYDCHSSDGMKTATHTLKTHPRIVQVVWLNFV